MKRKLLLLMCAVLASVGAWAQTWTSGSEVSTGEFYLYNIGSERFITQGCWWGTHMAADGAGKVITISGSADAYNLHMAGVDAAKYLSGGAYTDTPVAEDKTVTTDDNLQWTFETVSVAGYTNAYKIKNNSTGTYLRSYTADTNTGHKVEVETLADDNSFYWLLIPKVTRETLTGATSANPKDATHLVTNPDGEWYIRYENEAWKEYTHGGWDGTFSHNSSDQDYYVSSFYEIWTGTWATSNGTQVGNNWHLNDFDEYNEITGLPNGKYRITMSVEATQQGDAETITGASLYATANYQSGETAVSTRGNYNVDCVVTDGTITAGIKTVSTTANWVSFDNLRLTYYGNAVSYYSPSSFTSGAAAVADTWYAFTVSSAGIYKIASDGNPTIYYTQDNSDDADETTSVTLKGSAGSYYTVLRLSAGTLYFKVDAINAISITEGYDVDDDLTTLLANPDFSTNDLSGWTINTSSGYSNPVVDTNNKDCEFYEKKFDMSQTLTGMKKGTYEVSFQAFQRPGGNSDALLAAYKGGTWTSLATLKTSAERTAVPNIYSADRTTAIFSNDEKGEVWPYDLSATYDETKYYVPNSMEGARNWFDTEVGSTGVNYYTTTARAICTEDGGSMYFGFEGDLTTTSYAWLIFANFQLKYIDTDVLVDPTASETLIAEATTLAARAMNSSVRDDLQDAIDDLVAEKTSGDLYAALEAEMTTAEASADNYALLATAITDVTNARKTANEGSGVFQIPTAAGTTLATAIATAQGVYDAETVSDVTSAVTTLNSAKSTYEDAILNAPDAEKRYYLSIIDDGQDWDGYAITFVAGGRSGEGNYNMQYLADANANLCQALKFTPVGGSANTYNISAVRPDGDEQYMTTKLKAYSSGAHGQLRTTNDPDLAAPIKIQATATNGQFKLLNVLADNAVIARNNTTPDNGVYTDGDASFTIAEASQASVDVAVNSGKFATRIFPFAPGSIDGITFYSCNEVADNKATLVEVAEPAANTPYILKASKDVDTSVSGWGCGKAVSETAGYLTGVFTADTFAASVEPSAETAGAYRYVLQTQNDVQAFYKVSSDFTATANRAFLTVPVAATGGGEVKAFYLDFGDETAIKTVEAAQYENAVIYNLAGQRINKTQKGVNIVNGKKVLVK